MNQPEKSFPSLAPSLLVSMPQLDDPNFQRSVILLCEHGEGGAFGLVLNQRTTTPASEVVRLTPPVSSGSNLELWIGGPVEPERGWILMGAEPGEVESVRVCDGIFLSTSPRLLRRLLESPPPPRTRLLTGYSGVGGRTARRGARRVELAARRRRPGHRLRHAPRRHVGSGDPSHGGRSVVPAAGRHRRRALTRVATGSPRWNPASHREWVSEPLSTRRCRKTYLYGEQIRYSVS